MIALGLLAGVVLAAILGHAASLQFHVDGWMVFSFVLALVFAYNLFQLYSSFAIAASIKKELDEEKSK